MPRSARRVALLSTHSSPLALPGTTKAGGMNVYIRQLTRELAALGYTIDIFTRQDGVAPLEPVAIAPRVRLIALEAGPPEPLDSAAIQAVTPAFTAALLDYRRRSAQRYDLIHSHYWISGLTGVELAAAWRRPHLVMFHTLGAVKNRARRGESESEARIGAERAIVASADHFICATPHERDCLVDLYGAAPDSVTVVPGGVDLDRFRPGDRAAARARLGLGAGPFLLFVGRLEPLKGVDILLRAAAVADVDEPLRVLIAGGDERSSEERRRLEALADRLGIGDRVRFDAAVSHEALPDYYRAADLCVVPSYYESFGLVAVEALASGTPVVATAVGGLQYTVRDGQTGYLVPWRCPEPFAERIETLLANEDLRQRFGEAARRSVTAFQWPGVARRMSQVYEQLLDGREAGSAASTAMQATERSSSRRAVAARDGGRQRL